MQKKLELRYYYSLEGEFEEGFPPDPTDFDLTLMFSIGEVGQEPSHDYWVRICSPRRFEKSSQSVASRIPVLPFFSIDAVILQISALLAHVSSEWPEEWEYVLSKFFCWEYDYLDGKTH